MIIFRRFVFYFLSTDFIKLWFYGHSKAFDLEVSNLYSLFSCKPTSKFSNPCIFVRVTHHKRRLNTPGKQESLLLYTFIFQVLLQILPNFEVGLHKNYAIKKNMDFEWPYKQNSDTNRRTLMYDIQYTYKRVKSVKSICIALNECITQI